MMLLLQNKKTREEYWEDKETWDTAYADNKLQSKFNILKRSDSASGESKTSTVEVMTFVNTAREKSKQPIKVPAGMNEEKTESKEILKSKNKKDQNK